MPHLDEPPLIHLHQLHQQNQSNQKREEMIKEEEEKDNQILHKLKKYYLLVHVITDLVLAVCALVYQASWEKLVPYQFLKETSKL
jgi:hypothetical protein